jgi:NDP-sugar pyrophosphorylase family protein
MDIYLFEGDNWKNFIPISYTRGLWDIRIGLFTQKERFEKFFQKPLKVYSYRNYIKSDEIPKPGDLNINPMIKDPSLLPEIKEGEIIVSSGEMIASRSTEKNKDYKVIEIDIPYYRYLYEIIDEFPDVLRNDLYENFKQDKYIEDAVEIIQPVIINTRDGPVVIKKGSKIEPFTYIEGPVYIGENSLIKSGTRITGGNYFGRYSKISGEIEHTIFLGYSNKQHYGFLGHSYVGEWVNLGAGTTNSDLKNNYSEIRIKIEDIEVNTNLRFLGLMIGDHSKSAINTSFNTGTIVSPFSNIFTRNFPPKYIPPFSWVGDKIERYDIEKAIKTAEIVMKRRGVQMDEAYKNMVISLFEESEKIWEQFQ